MILDHPAAVQGRLRRAVAAATLCLLAAMPAAAGTALTVVGVDGTSLALTGGDLASLPQAEVAADFTTGHGAEHAVYEGPLLWAVLDRAGTPGKIDPRSRLRHAVLVTGRDGYAVLLSLGELDPDFEGKPAILALERDGKPDPDGQLRLVVPGDRKGGRAVRDVVEIRWQ